jgi:hypothetical protein
MHWVFSRESIGAHTAVVSPVNATSGTSSKLLICPRSTPQPPLLSQ